MGIWLRGWVEQKETKELKSLSRPEQQPTNDRYYVWFAYSIFKGPLFSMPKSLGPVEI